MKIEIQGMKEDLKKIDEALEPFVKDFEEGYKESMQKALTSRKARFLGLTKKIANLMPEEIVCYHMIENGKVYVVNTLPDNAIAKRTGQYKKIEEGLSRYLTDLGFKVKVKCIKHEVK